ncbi:hypothetical protein ACP8FL_17245, partial [Klebsiella pneumoniae]
SHPQTVVNSSYWQALFQAELGCAHGGHAGRRKAVGKGKRLERIPGVVVNEVLARLDAMLS